MHDMFIKGTAKDLQYGRFLKGIDSQQKWSILEKLIHHDLDIIEKFTKTTLGKPKSWERFKQLMTPEWDKLPKNWDEFITWKTKHLTLIDMDKAKQVHLVRIQSMEGDIVDFPVDINLYESTIKELEQDTKTAEDVMLGVHIHMLKTISKIYQDKILDAQNNARYKESNELKRVLDDLNQFLLESNSHMKSNRDYIGRS